MRKGKARQEEEDRLHQINHEGGSELHGERAHVLSRGRRVAGRADQRSHIRLRIADSHRHNQIEDTGYPGERFG
jgi:hypothetical protein